MKFKLYSTPLIEDIINNIFVLFLNALYIADKNLLMLETNLFYTQHIKCLENQYE